MIQLVEKEVLRSAERDILRRFSRPDLRLDPNNHVIPLLDEVSFLGMTFAITPLLEDDLISPWYFNLGEALDAISQTFKVSRYAIM